MKLLSWFSKNKNAKGSQLPVPAAPPAPPATNYLPVPVDTSAMAMPTDELGIEVASPRECYCALRNRGLSEEQAWFQTIAFFPQAYTGHPSMDMPILPSVQERPFEIDIYWEIFEYSTAPTPDRKHWWERHWNREPWLLYDLYWLAKAPGNYWYMPICVAEDTPLWHMFRHGIVDLREMRTGSVPQGQVAAYVPIGRYSNAVYRLSTEWIEYLDARHEAVGKPLMGNVRQAKALREMEEYLVSKARSDDARWEQRHNALAARGFVEPLGDGPL